MFKSSDLKEVHLISEMTSYHVLKKDMIKTMLINGLTLEEYIDNNLEDIRSFYIESDEPYIRLLFDKDNYYGRKEPYYNDVVYVQFFFNNNKWTKRDLFWFSDYEFGANYLQRTGKKEDNYYFLFDYSNTVPNYLSNYPLEALVKFELNQPIDHKITEKDLDNIKDLNITIDSDSIFKSFKEISEDLKLFKNIESLKLSFSNSNQNNDVDLKVLNSLKKLRTLNLYGKKTNF